MRRDAGVTGEECDGTLQSEQDVPILAGANVKQGGTAGIALVLEWTGAF